MSSGVFVTIDGNDRITRQLNSVNPLMAEAALMKLAKATQQVAIGLAPVDLGKGRDSIGVRPSGSMALEVYTDEEHMVVQEFGRAPNSTPPPAASLRGWTSRHGIRARDSQGRFAKGTLFMLARSIGRKGFRGKFFMTKAARFAESQLDAYTGMASVDIETKWNSM